MTLSAEHLHKIEQVLDRQVQIPSLEMLSAAVGLRKKSDGELGEIAIGLDANVLLKLAGHRQRADIVDYFGGRHEAPLILPGQIIQEFWNNQFGAMQSVAAQVKRHFDLLGAEVIKVDSSFGAFSERANALLGELGAEYGYIRDNSTIGHLTSICEMLSARARVSYVPRTAFSHIAAQRKRTRTPPGFKDDGDGDFFVWADFLSGLLREREMGARFEHAVLVTDDRKTDWSLGGVTHPILSAEVYAVTGASFEIWSLDKLGKEVTKAVAAESPADDPAAESAMEEIPVADPSEREPD